jgi:hypothetical protein
LTVELDDEISLVSKCIAAYEFERETYTRQRKLGAPIDAERLRICKWQIAEEEKKLNRLCGLRTEREIAAALQRGSAGEVPAIDPFAG